MANNEIEIRELIGTELALNVSLQYGNKFAEMFPILQPQKFDDVCEDMRASW